MNFDFFNSIITNGIHIFNTSYVFRINLYLYIVLQSFFLFFIIKKPKLKDLYKSSLNILRISFIIFAIYFFMEAKFGYQFDLYDSKKGIAFMAVLILINVISTNKSIKKIYHI